MKGVPVKRMTLPRIPAPPGVTRGHRNRPTTTNRQPPPGDSAGFSEPQEDTMTTHQPGPDDL